MTSLVEKFSKPVPRYTSYPTAPHFHAGIDDATYATWLADLPEQASLSLYLHLPFCDRLCWFCGCHTKQVNRYDPVTRYLLALQAEVDRVGAMAGGGKVTALHWGGGSPSLLRPSDIADMTARIRRAFKVRPEAEFSVELDPNDMDEARFDAWALAGMTRASIGVQDFDPIVQAAINREQTFTQTQHVVLAVRSRGVRSVNIDMLYGLPHQTVAGAVVTATQVASLRPDRVALFGYAHVPWMKKHQTMIDEAALPDGPARFEQAEAAAAVFLAAGYLPIGMDHFALPHDSLAIAYGQGRLQRNFQGYTADRHDALIGLGASAIGKLPQGYVQNVVATHDYQQRALNGVGVIARGVAFAGDDVIRGHVIERLMCDFALDFSSLRAAFGADAEEVIGEAIAIGLADGDGLVRLLPGAMEITERGRPFVRTLASKFDAYLVGDSARYSRAV
ncbi:oxygen-independent coproporphyrinogen III oxidase [Devosia sp.]|uniref:oxygen-independent coproporphyrinogen III oxidase n=1 Tax=Devosia sp. TaxID=1871048 RepID=UPI0032633EA8